MAQRPFRLPYTNRDFESIAAAVKSTIPGEVPEWNDFLQSNVGIFLIHSFAAIADLEAFYIDRQASECYIGTAIARPSIADLLQLINFQIRNAVPSYTTIRISIPQASASDIIIPQFSEFSDRSGTTRFVTAVSTTLVAGSLYVDVTARQGAWNADHHVSNGSSQQRYILSRNDIAEGFIKVTVGTEEWSQAEYNTFVGYGPEDKVFRVVTTGLSDMVVTSVEFGDGIEGKIPPNRVPILLDFLVTHGAQVRVPTGSISAPITLFYDALGNNVTVTALNIDAGTGGMDPETIESARKRYPSRFRTMSRAITKYDFQVFSEQFDGVLLSIVYDLNDNAETDDPASLTDRNPIPVSSAIPFYQARVYVVPQAGYSSDALNSSLQSYLQAKSSVDKQVVVLSPVPVVTNVSVQIRVFRNYDQNSVRTSVVTALQEFFKLSLEGYVQIATDLPLSVLTSIIQQVPGVASSTIMTPADDVTIQFDQILKLGLLTVEVTGIV